jgi:Holliday junction resolvase RusA-like endonuclease
MEPLRIIFHNFTPVSVNSGYFRNRSLNDDSRKVRARILRELTLQYSSNLNKFRSQYDPKTMALSVSMTFYRSVFFNKNGTISIRSKDLDNCIKITQDALFNKRYTDEWLSLRKRAEKLLYGSLTSVLNIGIDDINIVTLNLNKKPFTQDLLTVEVRLVPLPDPSGPDFSVFC